MQRIHFEQLKFLDIHDLTLLSKEVNAVLSEKRKSLYVEQRRIRFNEKNNDLANAIFNAENNQDIFKHNSENLLIPIGHGSKKFNISIHYLPALIAQDWSFIFKDRDLSEEKKFYVYAHINPMNPAFTSSDFSGGKYKGTPFYIGKGCGDRAYDLKRSEGHGKMIQKIKNKGFEKEDIVKIIKTDLNELEAFELEAKLIFFFGTVYSENKGHLYNLDNQYKPKFSGIMKPMKIDGIDY